MRIEKKIQKQKSMTWCFVFVGVIAMMTAHCLAFEGGSWEAVEPSSTEKFVQVATGNEKTVIARSSKGDVYQLVNGSWKPLGGGKARWIAAGSDGSIFAVGKDTRKLYAHSVNEWIEIPGIDKLSRVIVLDKDHMWGTLRTKQGVDVWQFENGKWARPLGADGKTPAVNWGNIAVAPGVFLVTDMSGNLMMRSTKVAPAKITPVKKAAKKSAKKKSAKKKKEAAGKKAKKKTGKKKTGKKVKKKAASKKKAGKKAKKKGAKKKKKAGKKQSGKKKAAKKKSSKKKKKSANKKAAKKSGKKKSAKKKKAAGKKKTGKKAKKKSGKKKDAAKKKSSKKKKKSVSKKAASKKKSSSKKSSRPKGAARKKRAKSKKSAAKKSSEV